MSYRQENIIADYEVALIRMWGQKNINEYESEAKAINTSGSLDSTSFLRLV